MSCGEPNISYVDLSFEVFCLLLFFAGDFLLRLSTSRFGSQKALRNTLKGQFVVAGLDATRKTY